MTLKSTCIIIVATILSVIGLSAFWNLALTDEKTIVVNSKEYAHNGDHGQYLVFTDEETYKIEDNFWHGQWRSADLYGKIKEGKTYRIKTSGAFLSPFETIYEIEEVKD